jgi:hypothetical protein
MALSVSHSLLPFHNIWCQRAPCIKLQHTDSRYETEELFIITASSDLTLHFYSFISLSYDRSTASSKANSPDSAI